MIIELIPDDEIPAEAPAAAVHHNRFSPLPPPGQKTRTIRNNDLIPDRGYHPIPGEPLIWVAKVQREELKQREFDERSRKEEGKVAENTPRSRKRGLPSA
jgi:hypothetical protein